MEDLLDPMGDLAVPMDIFRRGLQVSIPFSTTIWEFCKSKGFPYFVITAEDPCTEHVLSCCLLLNLGKIYTFTRIQEGVAARHVIF